MNGYFACDGKFSTGKLKKSMNTHKKEEETYEKNKKICKFCAGGMHGRELAGKRSGRDGIGGRTR